MGRKRDKKTVTGREQERITTAEAPRINYRLNLLCRFFWSFFQSVGSQQE